MWTTLRDSIHETLLSQRQCTQRPDAQQLRCLSSRHCLRQCIHRNHQRIADRRRDTHWKVARDLCSRYDHVLLPSFRTSEMVKREGRRINRDTVRQMQYWAHFQFKERLRHTALKTGVAVHEVSEAYSTIACGRCGRLNHKLGGGEVFECPTCPYRCDRDAHAARNILVMNVERCVGDVMWEEGEDEGQRAREEEKRKEG
jgi:IS605 OrfB family transposase